jgi:perosamine synthetase
MILTDDDSYFKKAKYLTTQAKDDEIRYIHNEVGYNYRLTNIQAALGVAQMEQLQDFLINKKNNYLLYKTNLNKIDGLRIAETPEYAENNNWMYALQIDPAKYGKDREELMSYLDTCNIQTRPVWYLNHLQKEFMNCQSFCIENAGYLHDSTLNLPCSVNLSLTDINKVIDGIIKGCKLT